MIQSIQSTICLERPNAPVNEPTAENKSAENDQKHRPPPKTFWIKPTDKRVPFVCLPIRQCPHDFIENDRKYANKIFVVSNLNRTGVCEVCQMPELTRFVST